MSIATIRATYHNKPLHALSYQEREALASELEVQHRVAVVDAAKVEREIKTLTEQFNAKIRELQADLGAKRQRVVEIDRGIGVLRDI